MALLSFESALGAIEISGDDAFITAVHLADEFRPSTETIPPLLLEARRQLEDYFSGTRKTFELPLKQEGTAFQQRVWNELLNIPFGQTISYLELARRLGDEKSIRAAGTANGKNSIAILVPCHRVIGSDRSLTGYAGGLHRKEWLLRHEGSLPGMEQTSLF